MQTTTAPPAAETVERLRVPLGAGVLVLLIACGLSLMVGSNGTASPGQVVQALTGHADPQLTAAVQSLRLPRTVLAPRRSPGPAPRWGASPAPARAPRPAR